MLFVAGCGNKEPEQRAAFIALLESKVIPAKGLTLPSLSASEKRSIGDYLDHYALLRDFQTDVSEATARNTTGMLTLNKLESLGAIAKERRSLESAADEARKLQKNITSLRQKADKTRAGLKQPSDLADVYTVAYNKAVRIPAETSAATFTAAAETFTAIINLLDFIDAHSKDLAIDGQDIQIKNPALQQDLDKHMSTVQERSRLLRQAHAAQVQALL